MCNEYLKEILSCSVSIRCAISVLNFSSYFALKHWKQSQCVKLLFLCLSVYLLSVYRFQVAYFTPILVREKVCICSFWRHYRERESGRKRSSMRVVIRNVVCSVCVVNMHSEQ